MSTKKVVKNHRLDCVMTLLSLGFVIVAITAFILLAFHAYSLIFISPDAASLTRGISILALMVISLGLIIVYRR